MKTNQQHPDRRHYQRFCVNTAIHLTMIGSNCYFTGHSYNLSAGGIRFITQENRLKTGMLLELSIPHQQNPSQKPALQSLIEIVRINSLDDGRHVEISACMK